jgi:hypothetical protein
MSRSGMIERKAHLAMEVNRIVEARSLSRQQRNLPAWLRHGGGCNICSSFAGRIANLSRPPLPKDLGR